MADGGETGGASDDAFCALARRRAVVDAAARSSRRRARLTQARAAPSSAADRARVCVHARVARGARGRARGGGRTVPLHRMSSPHSSRVAPARPRTPSRARPPEPRPPRGRTRPGRSKLAEAPRRLSGARARAWGPLVGAGARASARDLERRDGPRGRTRGGGELCHVRRSGCAPHANASDGESTGSVSSSEGGGRSVRRGRQGSSRAAHPPTPPPSAFLPSGEGRLHAAVRARDGAGSAAARGGRGVDHCGRRARAESALHVAASLGDDGAPRDARRGARLRRRLRSRRRTTAQAHAATSRRAKLRHVRGAAHGRGFAAQRDRAGDSSARRGRRRRGPRRGGAARGRRRRHAARRRRRRSQRGVRETRGSPRGATRGKRRRCTRASAPAATGGPGLRR